MAARVTWPTYRDGKKIPPNMDNKGGYDVFGGRAWERLNTELWAMRRLLAADLGSPVHAGTNGSENSASSK